jgi:hypothetical protein
MYDTPEWAYTSLIAKEFNTTHLNFGLASSSLEYTFHQFEQQRNNLVEGDIVIITLSLPDKTFFFHDRPALSHLWSFETEQHTVEEKNALEIYYKQLHNSKNIVVNLLNFLHSVQEVTKRKGLKTVVFKTFINEFDSEINNERYPDLIVANGSLWEFMKLEISQVTLLSYLNTNKFVNDSRLFHFSEPNHKIIADSIISAIKYNTEINLENVLLRNIFDWNSYNQSRL